MRAALVVVLVALVGGVARADELRLVRQQMVATPTGSSFVRELLPLEDQSLVIVADGFLRTAGPGRVVTELSITKLAADGSTVWALAWGDPEAGPYGAVASGAVRDADGGFLVAAQTVYDEPARGFVLRVAASGELLEAIAIGEPDTDVEDVALTGQRAHAVGRQLLSFDPTSPSQKRATAVTATETSNGDLVGFSNGNIYFGATTETSPSRDFTLSRVREGGLYSQVTLGGSSDDQLWAIAVSPDESRAFAVGRTLGIGASSELSDFPYRRPLLPFGGGADATVVMFADGAVLAATPWGGNALDSAYDVVRAPNGDFVVVGETESTNFPLVEPVHPGGDSGRAYATWFGADLSAVTYSTRLGSEMSQAQCVAFDASGRAVIAGSHVGGVRVMWLEEVSDPFVTGGGNDWWVEVDTGGLGFVPDAVEAQIAGTWRPLRKQAWGTWAESYFVASASVIRFRATGAGQAVASRGYLWPHGAAVPYDDMTFGAAFVEPRGNGWWLEVDVGANRALASVQARLGSGAWFELPRTNWGSYAVSRQVPAGSAVQFRATDPSGASVSSLLMSWPP